MSDLAADRLIVGLGNPGPQYGETRHNAGFLLLDLLLHQFEACRHTTESPSLLWSARWRELRLYLMKPMTYMNLSGCALTAFLEDHPMQHRQILVAYDDVALPLGVIRARPGGSAGGQKGMRHIIELLGTEEIPRLRIGIGSPGPEQPMSDYVLSPFTSTEWPLFQRVLRVAGKAVRAWLEEDMAAVMAAFNAKRPIGLDSEDQQPSESIQGGENIE